MLLTRVIPVLISIKLSKLATCNQCFTTVYEKFQKDDIAILDNERTLFDWASKQTYIALGNMMTGAKMLGVDSCPIEGFDYKAVNQLLADEGLFDPDEWGVSVMVTFGFSDKDIRPKSRKSLDEIVKFVV